MCCDGRCGPGQEAREGMRAVAGQFHPVGDLAEGGLDPVAPFGDGFQQARWYRGVLLLARWDEDGGAAGGLRGGERLAFEALVGEQGTWRRAELPLVPGAGLCCRRGESATVIRSNSARTS